MASWEGTCHRTAQIVCMKQLCETVRYVATHAIQETIIST